MSFRKSPPTIKRQTRAYDRENRECAEIILAGPHLYARGMVLWSELFMKRMEERKCPGPQMRLKPTTEG
jgi:hypothetical protein